MGRRIEMRPAAVARITAAGRDSTRHQREVATRERRDAARAAREEQAANRALPPSRGSPQVRARKAGPGNNTVAIQPFPRGARARCRGPGQCGRAAGAGIAPDARGLRTSAAASVPALREGIPIHAVSSSPYPRFQSTRASAYAKHAASCEMRRALKTASETRPNFLHSARDNVFIPSPAERASKIAEYAATRADSGSTEVAQPRARGTRRHAGASEPVLRWRVSTRRKRAGWPFECGASGCALGRERGRPTRRGAVQCSAVQCRRAGLDPPSPRGGHPGAAQQVPPYGCRAGRHR